MSFSRLASTLTATATVLVLISSSACKNKSETDTGDKKQAEHIPHLHTNNLSQGNSSLLTSQAKSPIHWQTWSKAIFADAAKEQKTVFAFIASGTDSYAIETLELLNSSPQTTATLNKHHINILVDSNLHSDLQYFAANLCLKSGSATSTPLLVWFSHEGIPISWIPIARSYNLNVANFIERTSHTVSRLWQDSPDYVLKNSRSDFTRRMSHRLPSPVTDEDQLLTIRATRQAASLFDPTSSTIDGLGGLSVGRHVKLLTAAYSHPDISERQRARYLDVATRTADKMMLQGLIDPLDGGIYKGVQKTTSALPIFSKDIRTHAHSIDALYSLYQISGETRFLEAADNLVNYVKQNLTLPDGGYSMGTIYAGNRPQDNGCTWTLEELEAALTPEEVKLCSLAFGIRGLGNIPLVDDRDRAYFRQNTLTRNLSPDKLAQQSGLSQEALSEQLGSITKKLAKRRTEKSTKTIVEKLTTVETIALLSSAYVTAYRTTLDRKHLDQAINNLQFIESQFITETGQLLHARYNGKTLPQAAHGIDYASVTKLALDLHEVTLDPAWLKLATSTHEAMAKQLGNPLNHHIPESNGAEYPYPYSPHQLLNIPTLNNQSTWAITYSNAKRLSKIQASQSLEEQCSELLGIASAAISLSPLASIDLLTEDAKLQHPTVFLKTPASPELLKAALKHPCQIIAVNNTNLQSGQYPELKPFAAELPSQGAIVIQGSKKLGISTQGEELKQILQ